MSIFRRKQFTNNLSLLSSIKRFSLCSVANQRRSKSTLGDDIYSIPAKQSTDDADIEMIIKVAPPVRPANEPLPVKRARLLYSSRKRGILECDLLLSTFSQKNLQSMNADQLQEFDAFMEENDWDIYYWLTNAKVPPPHIVSMEIFPMLLEHSKNKDRTILRMPSLH